MCVYSVLLSSMQAREKAAQKQQEMAQEQEDNLTELSNHVHGDLLTEDPAVAQSAFGPHRFLTVIRLSLISWSSLSPVPHASKHLVISNHKTTCRMCKIFSINDRVIPDRWKGMSPRQIGEIRATQGQQKLEKQVTTLRVYSGSILKVSFIQSVLYQRFHCLSKIINHVNEKVLYVFLPPLLYIQTLQSEEREREREWERRRIAEARAGLVLETQLNRCRKDDLKKLAQENRQMAEEQLARLALQSTHTLHGHC